MTRQLGDSGFSDYRKLSSPVKSPLGTLRHGVHAASETNRAIKLLRHDLTSNEEFLMWYRAGLSMACRVKKESGVIPGLLTPISHSADPLTQRENTLAVEREWFPGENLCEFLRSKAKYGTGLDEPVALSIFWESIKIIGQLHSRGVPHLNLKPENIIIGRDHRSGDMTVNITDACTAIAKPLPGGVRAEARLNYCSASFLEDPGYLKTSSDLYSCGMLLYLLLENKDLAPDNMGRDSLVTWLREKLPAVILGLELTSAKSARGIITRCLTEKSAERFRDIQELQESVSQALGEANPTQTLNNFVRGPEKKQEEEKIDPSPHPDPIVKKLLKPLMVAGLLVAVALLGFWAYSGYETSRLNDSIDSEIGAISVALRDIESVSGDCFSSDQITSFRSSANQVKSLQNNGLLDSALGFSQELRAEVESRRKSIELCDRFMKLGNRALIASNRHANKAGFDVLWSIYSDASKSAKRSQYAEQALFSLETAVEDLEDFDASEPPCGAAELDLLGTLTLNLPENCSGQALALLDSAQQACRNQDGDLFDEISAELRGMVERCDDGGALADSAKNALSQAENTLNNVKSEFDGNELFYRRSSDYRRGLKGLKTARRSLANQKWRAVLLNADLAINSFKAIKPCAELMDQYYAMKSSFGEDNPCFMTFDDLVRRCKCDEARSALRRPPCDTAKITFDFCFKELYSKGSYKRAEECFQGLDTEDDMYAYGQRFVALIRARNGQFNETFRKAFAAAGNKIQKSNSKDDIDLHLGMACYYGWNKSRTWCDSALYYFDIAQNQGTMFNTADLAWRGLLVQVRCLMKSKNRDYPRIEGAMRTFEHVYPRWSDRNDKYRKEIDAFSAEILK